MDQSSIYVLVMSCKISDLDLREFGMFVSRSFIPFIAPAPNSY